MYLDHYIAKLLEQHECVIVPDFGAFISNERQLYINEKEGKIYPATKRLAFNPSLSFNDLDPMERKMGRHKKAGSSVTLVGFYGHVCHTAKIQQWSSAVCPPAICSISASGRPQPG